MSALSVGCLDFLSSRSAPKGGGIVLGIEDGWVVAAYLLCVGSSILCVLYGLFTWNKGEEPIRQEDLDWAQEEKVEVEESL
jgi:hypothetical protein